MGGVTWDPQKSWSNYHRNFSKKIGGLYLVTNPATNNALNDYNSTTTELQGLLAEAAMHHTLRCYGSGWSFSEIGHARGRLINNKNLTIYFQLTGQNLDPGFVGNQERVFLFQAGTTIKKISAELDKKGLSLKTSGASDGQTIAGALSTGTHGSAINFGAVPEFVIGLHIATSPSESIWIERGSVPVASPILVKSFGATLVRDDALFDAALVGLGCFGVLLGVVLEAESRFLLEVYTKKVPLDANLCKAMDTFDFTNLGAGLSSENPHHFSLVVNPHRPDEAYVTLMYKRLYHPDYPHHSFADPDGGLGDDALELIGRAVDFLPVISDTQIPSLVTSLLEERYEAVKGAMGTHREVFPATSTRGPVSSTAIAVPRDEASVALKEVLQLHASNSVGPFPGALGIRFVKGTRATLGFTRFASTCVIEADGVLCDHSDRFNKELWNLFESRSGEYTMHWGKLNNITSRRVLKMYGSRVTDWKSARSRVLTDPSMQAVFSNPFTKRAGLT